MSAKNINLDFHSAQPLLTSHARERSIERQISAKQIRLVFSHGDLRAPTKDGRMECQISHRAAMRLRWLGIGPRNISLLTSIVLIIAESGSILTAYRC